MAKKEVFKSAAEANAFADGVNVASRCMGNLYARSYHDKWVVGDEDAPISTCSDKDESDALINGVRF